MAKPAVLADNMVITYNKGKSNEFQALKKINVEIYPREYIILFGPSGCGKSTLLYSILGGLVPSDGHLIVRGEDIYAYTPAEMNRYQRSTIGIVYQQFNLISSISVMDNVALPRIFMGTPPSERAERALGLLQRFGINDQIAKKLPTWLSGGQQQRVAVARALVNDPEILLADEPVGNLDSISAEHVMDSFQEINEKDRKTVILVTHDAKYLPYAHRVFYMRDGLLRRVVVNPEKKQIKRTKPGETIVTEIEQLARLYPYAEPIELKVKSVVNYVTQTLGFSQLGRLEKLILDVLKGFVDDALFYDQLVRPFDKGGIGVNETEAKDITRRVFILMRYSHDVQRFREIRGQDSAFINQSKFIDRLLEYMEKELGVQANADQKKALKEAVAERVGGMKNGDEFLQTMMLPPSMGGIAFDRDISNAISRNLEKMIAQGGYIILPNELLGAHT